ncbi:MAG TPA: trehalase family glycosidase, partial [Candidatus Saccharimonadales bacterium]|nr:trehalase family glycosidase [Candidatus Saccharimonadales bacterium]
MHKVFHSFRRRIQLVQNGLSLRRKSLDALLGDLFHDVQLHRVFPDSITFIDMVPPKRLNHILKEYKERRYDPDFDLVAFVNTHFVPAKQKSVYVTNKKHSVEEHIQDLWKVLRRTQYRDKGSLIGLPHPYIVAGGRFQSAFYWDSYFIMLGLAAGGRWKMVKNMTNNFAFLIRKYGCIPNGSRTYFISRSQPPFFAMMVRLLAEHEGEQTLVEYLPYLLAEHRFWMKGRASLKQGRSSAQRVVRMPGGEILNRYFDNKSTPRPEGYYEDLSTVLQNRTNPSKQYVNLRAAAESGWDFSSRWFADGKNLATIRTIDLVPVDLNCLLVLLEQTIAKAYTILRQKRAAAHYQALAKDRQEAINTYCWNEKKGFYFDYDLSAKKFSSSETLAAVFPLWAGIASQQQAQKVAKWLEERFLRKGGLVCTLVETGQQWDAPNGWPPLQWVAIRGLREYSL